MNQTNAQTPEHDPFRLQLIMALEHFDDLHWLTENSPLATPYFLGDYLNSEQSPFWGWGRALQTLLRQAADMVGQMQDVDEAGYLFRLIDVMYFQGLPPQHAADQLGVARATYYRHLKTKLPQAVHLMEKELVRLLRPGLRLEEPPKCKETILKRPQQFSQILQALNATQTVALTGRTGIGKTALAAQLFHHWKTHNKAAFWLTFRSGINEQLTGLLFALAYFLQINGAPGLWLQMVADRGQINGEIALGIARRDLIQLKTLPLLCFDNLDILSPIDIEMHAQIGSFISGLQGIVPILSIGQRIDIRIDTVISIPELSLEQIDQLLAQSQVHLPPPDVQHLFQFTKGNLRLLNLFIALHNYGDALTDTLPRLTTSPSLEFLVNRIWSRLDEQSRTILSGLSAFRTPAPQDAWGDQAQWAALTANQLVQTDEQGGIMLVPAFKRIIYEQLPSEEKENLHLNAAIIREKRGEYTAAAYHYIQGNRANHAIWLLNSHLQDQINQGQGQAMLEILAGLSKNSFDNPEREILVLLRSKLRQLIGEYPAIKADIYSTLWQTPAHEAQAQQIIGDVHHAQSHFDEAIRAYRTGIRQLEPMTAGMQLVMLHTSEGESQRLFRELDRSWEASQLARYELEHLQGDILRDLGRYTEAQIRYEKAFLLANKIGHTLGEGKTRNSLAILAERQGQTEVAIEHRLKAIACAEQVGDLVWVAGSKTNLGMVYSDSKRPQLAVPLLQEAISIFDSIGHSRGKAYAAFNLAEAYLALNAYDQADAMAQQSMREEEPGLVHANFYLLARIRQQQDDLTEAEIYFQKALREAERQQDSYLLALVCRDLSELHVQQQQLNEARERLSQAEALFETLKLTHEAEQVRTRLSQIM